MSYTLTTNTNSVFPGTGGIMVYLGTTDPNGWLICDGRSVSQSTYQSLFNLIGSTYGTGTGGASFNIPNLKSVFVCGASTTTTLTSSLTGSDTVTLDANTMTSHNHTVTTDGGKEITHYHTTNMGNVDDKNFTCGSDQWPTGDSPDYRAGNWSTGNANTTLTHAHSLTGSTSTAGGGTSFSIVPNYKKANYIIKF